VHKKGSILVKKSRQNESLSTERWTYDDMKAKLPAESRYELRNFSLIDMPSPKRVHQRIVKDFTKKLDNYVLSNQLGEVFVSPFDVILDKGNVCQPDVFFLSKETRGFSTE
jgi:Uma2 family endonuclease